MVKVTRDRAAANRDALLEAAGRLFRMHGMDGVGVAELCDAAGLTHGALYSRFGSKNELAAEAFRQGQAASRQRMMAAIGPVPGIAAVVDFYVSSRHRDNLSDCCPMLASASEAARQNETFAANFAAALREFQDIVRTAVKIEGAPDVDLSLAICASMIGAVSMARALKVVDPALSDTLLETSRVAITRAAEPRIAPKPGAKRARAAAGARRQTAPARR